MTAEIAILNTSGVALAADSAVTIQTKHRAKIFDSVSKLFTLSKYAPVGVMIYGGADFMSVPWEIIIKEYRRQLDTRTFETLKEYSDDLLSFLKRTDHPLFPEALAEEYLHRLITALFVDVNESIFSAIEEHLLNEGSISEDEISAVAETAILAFEAAMKEMKDLVDVGPPQARGMLKRRPGLVKEIRDQVFEDLPLTVKAQRALGRLAVLAIHKAGRIRSYSGLVIAGYGESEFFPSLYSFELDGAIDGVLRHHEGDSVVIGPGYSSATVIPFAQNEMVHTFMVGLDPSYRRVIDGFLEELMTRMPETLLGLAACSDWEEDQREVLRDEWRAARKKLMQDFHNALAQYGREEFSQPVVEMVTSLPKDELAAMAEALVNLHIFKRKVTPEAETVRGPIDVAVISKGDGFIWIKRKHYFRPELNPQFAANYFRREKDGGETRGE